MNSNKWIIGGRQTSSWVNDCLVSIWDDVLWFCCQGSEGTGPEQIQEHLCARPHVEAGWFFLTFNMSCKTNPRTIWKVNSSISGGSDSANPPQLAEHGSNWPEPAKTHTRLVLSLGNDCPISTEIWLAGISLGGGWKGQWRIISSSLLLVPSGVLNNCVCSAGSILVLWIFSFKYS